MLMKSPLSTLHKTAPDWATVSALNAASSGLFHVSASPLRGGGLPGKTYSLIVKEGQNEKQAIMVLEETPGQLLPMVCPERHINSDGSFCIGLGAGNNIVTVEDGNKWWLDLGEFLKYQQWAEKHRRWPPYRWLSHGEAAEDHLELEKLAKEHGLEDEVKQAIEYGEGWLAGILPRHSKNSGDMLVNQRLPCPRQCHKQKGKRSVPILRRNCPKKHLISMLVLHENRRRKYEETYIKELISKGVTCCGTMDKCHLRKLTETP